MPRSVWGGPGARRKPRSPHRGPRGTPIPTTSPPKASQGRHTFPTAWASLSAWGRGVRAAFLDRKESKTGLHGQLWAGEQRGAPGEAPGEAARVPAPPRPPFLPTGSSATPAHSYFLSPALRETR